MFFLYPSSTRGCKIQRFFESHGGKILGVFDFHEGEILWLKKFYGCKKKIRRSRRPKNFGLFFVQNQDFSGENYFFDLSGSEIFDIYKSGGCKFQRKLKSHWRKIWRLFFFELCLAGFKKKQTRRLIKKSKIWIFLRFFLKYCFY